MVVYTPKNAGSRLNVDGRGSCLISRGERRGCRGDVGRAGRENGKGLQKRSHLGGGMGSWRLRLREESAGVGYKQDMKVKRKQERKRRRVGIRASCGDMGSAGRGRSGRPMSGGTRADGCGSERQFHVVGPLEPERGGDRR